MKNELILVIDFGAQYNQLIARRVREANVYCEVLPYNASVERIRSMNPKGIIFTGGPATVLDPKAPFCDKEIFNLGVPILGICYGMQLMGHMLGGEIARADQREYGKMDIEVDTESVLFKGVESTTTCWMSHTYFVNRLPEGFKNIASSTNCPAGAMENAEKRFYGVQFHPEVMHTPRGQKMLNNFLYDICGRTGDWKMLAFVDDPRDNFIIFILLKYGTTG